MPQHELGQLSACFTLPVSDSIDGIFDAMKQGAIIHKTGGVPVTTSPISGPKARRSSQPKGVASGPVSFIRVFNAATK